MKQIAQSKATVSGRKKVQDMSRNHRENVGEGTSENNVSSVSFLVCCDHLKKTGRTGPKFQKIKAIPELRRNIFINNINKNI